MTENEEKTQETETEQAAAPVLDADAAHVAYELKEKRQEPGSVQRYVVEVERKVLDERLQESLANLRKNVTIEGFRRGKAPVQLLKIRYGKEAREDALAGLAENIGHQLVEKDALNAVSEPALHESKAEADQPVVLEIDIEVQPKIEVVEHTGRDYEVKARPVTDDLVDQQIEAIRQANVTFEEPKEAKAYEAGDGVTVDMVVTDGEGKRLESLCRENVFLRDPQSALISEVAEALKGKKAGDTFEQTVERTVKNRDGEDVTHKDMYRVTVRDVKVRVVPTLDDEFAKDVGDFETLDALRARVRQDLDEQESRSKRQQSMEQILNHLLEVNKFDAPRTMVASQEYQTIMRDTAQMRQLGVDLSAMGLTTEGYLANARANAERFVKTNLLIASIAEKEKIEATDEDVNKEIKRRAELEGRKELAIRARLEAEKQLDNLKRQLLVDKVEDFLMARNAIKEVETKESAE